MTKVIINERGEIPIPNEILESLNLGPGSEVALDVHDGAMVVSRLFPSPPSPTAGDWRTMEGMFRGAGDLMEELAKERALEQARDDQRLRSL
ncbi:MAG: AbrB/MazE/SpoVT family DNA-binding domain-containing protein [Acidobacteria bacterium]|nr:AbrB/MazE/SpoVT family DNA-binding domain-containing protein [Acidobacteriota bacterium]